MHDGKLILAGTTDDILDRVKRVRIVLDDTAATPVGADGRLQKLGDGDHFGGFSQITYDGIGRAWSWTGKQ